MINFGGFLAYLRSWAACYGLLGMRSSNIGSERDSNPPNQLKLKDKVAKWTLHDKKLVLVLVPWEKTSFYEMTKFLMRESSLVLSLCFSVSPSLSHSPLSLFSIFLCLFPATLSLSLSLFLTFIDVRSSSSNLMHLRTKMPKINYEDIVSSNLELKLNNAAKIKISRRNKWLHQGRPN